MLKALLEVPYKPNPGGKVGGPPEEIKEPNHFLPARWVYCRGYSGPVHHRTPGANYERPFQDFDFCCSTRHEMAPCFRANLAKKVEPMGGL